MKTAGMTGKIQKNFNVTLPKRLRELFHLHMGDYVKFLIVKEGILLKPKKLVDSSQAYFWIKEWQKEELEAEEDIRAGRVSKTKNAKELIKQLKK